MRRIVAGFTAAAVVLATPAFAQTSSPTPANSSRATQQSVQDNQSLLLDGQDAMGQQQNQNTGGPDLLTTGLVLGGIGGLAALVVTQTNRNRNNSVSP